jgi:uncharacterized protein YecE (DUF72 family)
MGEIQIGTCSWSDKSMVGPFYPEGIKPTDEITYYAEHFSTVEINSTFYRMPSPRSAEAWAERTPPGFTFHAKAFGPMTTHKSVWDGEEVKRATPEMLRAFEDAMAPLRDAGKFGYTLFQFPRWFFPSPENREYIEWCQDNMPATLMAVEFRNAYWVSEKRLDETLDWLSERGIVYTCVDEPQTSPKASAPPVYATTRRDVALLRLHGRNTENWEKPGVGVEERFQYDYSARELQTDILPNIEHLSTAAARTYVMFNNIHNGHGVSNAQLLLTAVEARLTPIP